MNTNQLLMLTLLVSLAVASNVQAEPLTLMEWLLNFFTFGLRVLTTYYCYGIGYLGIFNLNDGGDAFFRCYNAKLVPITWA
jgi:hypothetical protein